ncbi:MAG: acylphosphatase [Phycisphaerae bacterium]
MAAEQRIVKFKGNVQGVGFRYTSTRTAKQYEITGYVKNMPDGTVELVAEGEKKEIDAFLSDLKEQMSRHIRDTQQQTANPSGRYSSFGVAY